MKILMLAVIAVNVIGIFLFWTRDQNKVYALLMGSLLFLFGSTLYYDHNQEWKVYQSEYYRLVAEKESDPVVKKNILASSLSIKQIWTPDLGVADRCTTCHMGYDNPSMKDAPTPYKYHAAAREHDFNNTGCVICHAGQGKATTLGHAHGELDKHWETPLLPVKMAQSACGKCHDRSNIVGGEAASKGRQLFIKMGCHGCHKVKGYEKLYKVATSLKGAAHKLNPSWIVKWVQNPRSYLDNTKMPNFRLTEDQAVSAAAYILSQTDDSFKPAVQFVGGDPVLGEELVKKVGCLGCHAVNGEGSTFASDLGKLGSKVNEAWLVNWILDPQKYAPNTRMPKFRLSVTEANDMTAYLMTLGEKPTEFKFQEAMKDPNKIKEGKDLLQTKGCTACHDINGLTDSKIGPELTTVGAKDSHHLDFGNSHGIEHTWFSWVTNKIKNPTVYDTATIKANMPTFNLTDADREAIAIFLKGRDGTAVPSNFIERLSAKAFEIEEGNKVIEKYNCRGCHIVKNEGGDILSFYEGKSFAPPPLEMGTLHVGDRLSDSWLYSFLRNPTPVRKWLKVRMPTFPFSQEDIYYLTRYFVNFGENSLPLDENDTLKGTVPDEVLEQGRKLVLAFDCLDCHDGSRGPTFDIVSTRVRGTWAKKWLSDTQGIYPGTKMPNHWPMIEGKRVVGGKYPRAKSMLDGDPDKQMNAIWAYLANYNEKPMLNIELPPEEGDGEEEE